MKYRRRRGLGGGAPTRHGGAAEGGSAGDLPSRRGLRDLVLASPRSARRWAGGIAVLAGLFFAGYVIGGLAFGTSERELDVGPLVRVPELVGLSDAEARELVEAAGLSFQVRSGVPHARAPEGAVLAQSPLPGQGIRPGAPVGVTVSRGPAVHALPDVSGLSGRQATIVLERLGFRVSERRATHPAEPGRAFGTEPAAGTELPLPADVVLLVSEGPGLTPVPDLAGKYLDEALRLLVGADLELGAISYDPRAADPPGTIVGQYPPGGYTLRRGDAVEIRVAGDPERVNRSRARPVSDIEGEV